MEKGHDDEIRERESEEKGDSPSGHEEHKKRKRKDEIIEELSRALEEKEKALKELQERILYLQADFENFKKLKAKEKQDILRFGNEELIKALLPVLDNLERAIDHADRTEDLKSIQEGVQIVLNEFTKVLEKAGLTRVDALGKKFDPSFHEAFFQEERTDVEPDIVIAEHQKGYLLNGRLIRPSMVTLSKRPEDR